MATEDSSQSSALTRTRETTDSPSPAGSRRQGHPEVLDAPNPERTGQAVNTSTDSDDSSDSLQALIVSLQHDLRVQLQKQQRDFEVRIQSLLMAQGKADHTTVSQSSEVESSTLDSRSTPKGQDLPLNANTGKANDKTLEPSLDERYLPDPQHSSHQEHSPYVQSFSKPFHIQGQSL
jgi:hypothetical protein